MLTDALLRDGATLYAYATLGEASGGAESRDHTAGSEGLLIQRLVAVDQAKNRQAIVEGLGSLTALDWAVETGKQTHGGDASSMPAVPKGLSGCLLEACSVVVGSGRDEVRKAVMSLQVAASCCRVLGAITADSSGAVNRLQGAWMRHCLSQCEAMVSHGGADIASLWQVRDVDMDRGSSNLPQAYAAIYTKYPFQPMP